MQYPVVMDDARLAQLAAEPPRELFPVLRRSAALSPLVVVLAVLPGLFAVEHRHLTEDGAHWALRAVRVVTAVNLNEFLDPAGFTPSAPLQFQPPLGTWLTALVMSVGGTEHGITAVLPSLLATTGIVGMTFVLARRLVGLRAGLLATFLLAFNVQLLRLAQTPTPTAVGLVLALVTHWAFVSHLQESSGVASWRLLIGGIALGLCLLAAGPLALAVLAVLLAHVLLLQGERVRARRAERRVVWEGWPALRSLLVMLLTSFAVGGWWELMMFSVYGTEFLSEWLTGPMLNGATFFDFVPGVLAFARSVLARRLAEQGFLVGFLLIGLWWMGRELLQQQDEDRRRRMQFVLVWTVVAGLLWAISLTPNSPLTASSARWHAFLLVPLIVLAGSGLEAIATRSVGMPSIVTAIAVTLGVLVWLVSGSLVSDTNIGTAAGLLFGLLTAVGIAFWWTNQIGHEAEQRWLLSVLIAGLVFAHAVWGLLLVRADDPDDHRLTVFRERLARERDVEAAVLLSRPADPPPQLHYLVRSLWPTTPLTIAESWEGQPARFLGKPPARPGQTRVIVQWSRRDERILVPPDSGWQIERLSEPIKYRDRQLSAWRLHARSS